MGSSLLRWGRHAWHALGCDGRWLDAAARQRIAERIAASEAGHGGEIRVCIERALPAAALRQGVSARERAQVCFGELGVWDTDERCGVLVYLLLAERAIELVADRGITARLPPGRWQTLVDSLGSALRAHEREAGLLSTIDALDALLREHFPLRAGQANPNELTDQPLLR
jgi:uncharacterized membrane protein